MNFVLRFAYSLTMEYSVARKAAIITLILHMPWRKYFYQFRIHLSSMKNLCVLKRIMWKFPLSMARNHTSVCLPWSSWSKCESYTVNTCPFFYVVIQYDKDCVGLSSAVFQICGQQPVNVSYNSRSGVHRMQSVICSLKSAVCSLQSAYVRHRFYAYSRGISGCPYLET